MIGGAGGDRLNGGADGDEFRYLAPNLGSDIMSDGTNVTSRTTCLELAGYV